MATISRGYSFGATETVTAAKLHTLVDSASIANIATADIADSNITNAKISDVSGAKFTNLANIPSGSGLIPVANLPVGTTASKIVQLDGSAKLPAIDGSQLTAVNAATLDTYDTSTTSGASKIYVSDANGFIPNQFGAWASKSNNTVYQADTDGFVCLKGSNVVRGYTDGNNPPTTLRLDFDISTGGSFTMPVRKGDYWKVTGASTVYWLPMGN